MGRYLTIEGLPLANPLRGRPMSLPDGNSGDEVELADIWRQLVVGRSAIVAHGATPSAFRLVLRRRRESLVVNLEGVELLRLVLLGADVATVANERGVTTSAVRDAISDCLGAFGVEYDVGVSGRRRVRPCPAMVAVAAHAAEGATALSRGRSQTISEGVTEVRLHRFDEALLSSARLSLTMSPALTRSAPNESSGFAGYELKTWESDLLRMLVDGLSVESIAGTRSAAVRSTRLVIDERISKLGVRTRAQLLSALIRRAT